LPLISVALAAPWMGGLLIKIRGICV